MFDVSHPNIEAEPLLEIPLMVVAAKGVLPSGDTIKLTQILPEPWIDYPDGTPMAKIVEDVFKDIPRPKPTIQVQSTISACQLALQKVRVALVAPFLS